MKVVAISDPHNQHEKLILPPGDVLVCGGDISGRGSSHEVFSFVNWFARQTHKHKIFIAGNHDFWFQKRHSNDLENLLLGRGITYLEDSEVVIDGVKFYGSPWTPMFYNWAFMKERGEEIKAQWDLIPKDTDVLITHGPPESILDRNMYGDPCGCEELYKAVKRIKPKFHIFGHIHEGAGVLSLGGTTYINAALLNDEYRLVNQPRVFEI